MKRQRDKGHEAARFILQAAQRQQVLDALLFGLNVAVEHRGVRTQAHLVRRARDVQPLLAADLVVADDLAHARAKISAPPPGSESTPASFSATSLADGKFRDAREIAHLDHRKGLQVHARAALLKPRIKSRKYSNGKSGCRPPTM